MVQRSFSAVNKCWYLSDNYVDLTSVIGELFGALIELRWLWVYVWKYQVINELWWMQTFINPDTF